MPRLHPSPLGQHVSIQPENVPNVAVLRRCTLVRASSRAKPRARSQGSSGEKSMGRMKVLGAALLGLIVATPALAQRPVWEQSGTLSCDVSAGIGFVVGSQRQVNCLFTPSYPAPPEQYVGTI